jgi:hypothetical protein
VSGAIALSQALTQAGFDCTVEAHDRLAVIVPDDADAAARLAEPAARRTASALAREHGFTHAALELVATDGEGQGAPGARAALRRD